MSRAIDETGNEYGRLTVLARAKNDNGGKVRWRCRCKCGKQATIHGSSLRRGLSRSCGCLSRETTIKIRKAKCQYSGQKFGRWTVVGQNPDSNPGVPKWFCRCNCGVIRSLQISGLKTGRSRSCGCWGREIRPQKYRKRPFHVAYNAVLKRAKKKNIECLSYKEFLEFTKIDICHYCGCRIIWTPHTRGYNKNVLSGHGELGGWRTYLDRIDSSLGYTPDNIVVACVKCNYAKNADSYDDYLTRCQAVALKHPIAESLLKVL